MHYCVPPTESCCENLAYMPQLLHEEQGLKIVKNDRNRFCVVTLHYTADPSKRSEAWKKEAMAGLSPAKFAKEYEIDYEAMFGEKVFPEIVTNSSRIVVKEPYPEFSKHLPYWGGFDYGIRNPSSFHVYTMIDGCLFAIWEMYEQCKNILEFTAAMKTCPYWDRIKFIAADPSMWQNRTHSAKTGMMMSVVDQFIEQGISKLVPGNNDEIAWISTMRQLWGNSDDPLFRILETCPMMIREFETAVFVNMTEGAAATRNYREAIVDKDNHALDDCKYFMNSRPSYESKKIQYPDMWKRWMK